MISDGRDKSNERKQKKKKKESNDCSVYYSKKKKKKKDPLIANEQKQENHIISYIYNVQEYPFSFCRSMNDQILMHCIYICMWINISSFKGTARFVVPCHWSREMDYRSHKLFLSIYCTVVIFSYEMILNYCRDLQSWRIYCWRIQIWYNLIDCNIWIRGPRPDRDWQYQH